MGAFNTDILNTNTINATSAITTTLSASSLQTTTLQIYNTGSTIAFNILNDGTIETNGGSGTNSGIAIHQRSFTQPKIIDVFNQDYSLRYLYIYDDGVTGLVTLSNNTVSIDAYSNTVSIPSGTFYIKAKTTMQDFAVFTPLLGGGGVYFNSNSDNHPYFYLQNSAATTTQVSISSSGNSYFNSGNVGIGTISPTEKLSIQNGNLALQTIGSKILIASGTNASVGVVTLTAGTATVNNNLVTTSSIIMLTHQNNSGTIGTPTISARVANTSFTITSTSASDTSLIAWSIIEPT